MRSLSIMPSVLYRNKESLLKMEIESAYKVIAERIQREIRKQRKSPENGD